MENAVYQYEHFDPIFSEATEHKAEGITLLCGGCHDKKTRGIIPIDIIKDSNNNPAARKLGFANDYFYLGKKGWPTIKMGPVIFNKCQVLLFIERESILTIEPGRELNEPFLISAILRDKDGNIHLAIEKNEWKTSTANWDSTLEGTTITIRSGSGNINLVLQSDPDNNTLIFDRIHMVHRGVTIDCYSNKDFIFKLSNDSKLLVTDATLNNCVGGIGLLNDRLILGYGCREEIFIKHMTIN